MHSRIDLALTRWPRGRLPRPLFAVLLNPVHLVLAGLLIAVALVNHAFLAVPAIVLVDLVLVGVVLAGPARRRGIVRHMRREQRARSSKRLRASDQARWTELEQTVAATGRCLPHSRRDELEQLLDLYIEVGTHTAVWEEQIDQLGQLPQTLAGPSSLALACEERRSRAKCAAQELSAQLATVALLIQVACEDAVALRASTLAGDISSRVDEVSRAAQLAVAATDDFYSPAKQPTPSQA